MKTEKLKFRRHDLPLLRNEINNHLNSNGMMKKEYVMQVVESIRGLLVTLVPADVLISWGLTGFIATVFENMPALKFHVSGRMHTGFVIIALNGSNHYAVYLQNGTDTKCLHDEVCFDELGELLDCHIS